MALSAAVQRHEVHRRLIDLKAYARDDGLYDIEAHLVDTKPFPFPLVARSEPLSVGEPLHDMSIRLTVNDDYVVQNVEASSDKTPFLICKEAETTLSSLVGERIGSGWSAIVKQKLQGASSCTHLRELLLPMATAAIQGINGARREGQNSVDPAQMKVKPDSCYAFAQHREVIQLYWPNLFVSKGQ
jgi:hypothetical protein